MEVTLRILIGFIIAFILHELTHLLVIFYYKIPIKAVILTKWTAFGFLIENNKYMNNQKILILLHFLPLIWCLIFFINPYEMFFLMFPLVNLFGGMGDFYNYFVFNRQHVGVAVGDVSGKGMQAALMMALSVGLLTTKLHKEMLPADLLSALNTELQPHTSRNWMNTAFSYVMLKPSTQHKWNLCVANAGMVAPLIRRQNGQVEWLNVSGLPLGMTDEIRYDELETIMGLKDLGLTN